MEKIKNPNQLIIGIILNKMFDISKQVISFEEAINIHPENWYTEYTMTKEQRNEWMNWAVNFLNKKKRWSKNKCKIEMMWVDFAYGLKIQN